MRVKTPEEMLEVETLPPTLTVPQVAKILGISKQTIYRAIDAGEIRSLMVRGRILVPSSVIKEFLDID